MPIPGAGDASCLTLPGCFPDGSVELIFRAPEAVVWLLRCERVGDLQPWLRHLPEELHRRGERLRHEPDRHRFAARHLFLRLVLAQALAVDFRRVEVIAGPFGKPVLPGPHPPVHFSLSRSDSLALLALAAHPVGVDVETIAKPSREWTRLSSMVFSDAEMDDLGDRGGPLEEAVFLQHWTVKEAILKAQGTGLQTPMSEIDLDMRSGELGLRRLPPGFPARERWRLAFLPLHPEAIAALAFWTGNGCQCAVRRFLQGRTGRSDP